MVSWLLAAGLGPAAVAVPVNWAADALAGAAQRWFKRLRRTDDLSRLVRAATGTSVDLTQAEFDAVRKLLEDQQTWSVAGRGTVEDLATRIADCLPPRDRRTVGDAHAAALTIARGLLEFAVADLDPKLFQQVLMARLQRMETGQASALDEALLGLHARFDSVMEQLKLVLDRLPPGPARRGEIEVYLRTLIDWLSSDPWPRDPQFGGSVLTPAAIERKLRITATGREREQDLDADGLAQQCRRLVILGGPGAGKTWLAKRTARRGAEDALEVLAAGGTLEEVELPLYTTCSRLFSTGGDIREAVVSSALGQIGDLGGSRISKALGMFFAERNAPTLLVIDSLDEAHGPSERLRQASTLPWRIVLTSRPSSWRHQLTINDTDDSHRVGELQPLDYPGDVEPFIASWFSDHPAWAAGLTVQLRDRPALQQAAAVPLILAFYCIIGGDQPLPGRRADLYAKVIRRMLTGRWRGSGDRDPDSDACLETLRDWAWSAAASDAVSGIGAWADEFATPRVRRSQDDRDALDHVAVPLGPPDPDTGMTQRRFVHRSLQEHLVAEHVALGMPAEAAAGELLKHLWYDPDWEYAAPAALAMHPQRDQVLKDLIRRMTRGDQHSADLAAIDGCWEIRRFLARLAQESGEGDWSPGAAEMIRQARLDLATSQLPDHSLIVASDGSTNGLIASRLLVANDWPTANGLIIELLLDLLTGEADPWRVGQLAGAIAQLAATAQDRARAWEALLSLFTGMTDCWTTPELSGAVARLAVTVEDGAQAREAVLGLLARVGPDVARVLAAAVARLDPPEDRARAREALLSLLADGTYPWMVSELAKRVALLAVTAEDRARAREALLSLLAHQSNTFSARSLAEVTAGLDPTAEERARAREALLGLLAASNDPQHVKSLADGVAGLTVTAEDRARAREALLSLLTRRAESGMARELAGVIAGLAVTAKERTRTREALLGLLTTGADISAAGELAERGRQAGPDGGGASPGPGGAVQPVHQVGRPLGSPGAGRRGRPAGGDGGGAGAGPESAA